MLVKSINLQLVGNKQVGLPITYYMEKNLPIVRKVRGGWGVIRWQCILGLLAIPRYTLRSVTRKNRQMSIIVAQKFSWMMKERNA